MKLLPTLVAGFTGTRRGLTTPQEVALERVVRDLGLAEGHHGDCEGADYAFHVMLLMFHVPHVVIHPPIDTRYRADCERFQSRWTKMTVMPPRDYLVRNHRIVNVAQTLIGAPRMSERPTSLRGEGTWTTIGYAERAGIPRVLVLPNGTVRRET